MFYPKYFGGVLRSWEYFPASAGIYQAGQLLNVADGLLVPLDAASTNTPPYLCQCRRTVVEGEIIPVVRISDDAIYETSLSADAANIQIGTKLQISAGGEQVDAAAEGSFEVVSFADTIAGAAVSGRFHFGSAGTAANVEVATDQEVSDAIDESYEKGE